LSVGAVLGAAGLRRIRGIDCLELHAQSQTQLDFAREYANARPELFELGF
jgi:hypothetical protein